MKIEIKLIESVMGNKPSEQIDFLSCRMRGEVKYMVAYLKGNGYVKLFTFQNFIDWYAYENEVETMDIEQDLYNRDRPFERFIMANIFGVTLPKEDLMFTHRGNGVGVCDRMREEYGDYMNVAHISYEREVKYYNKELSEEGKANIEDFAKSGNMMKSHTQQYEVLKPI